MWTLNCGLPLLPLVVAFLPAPEDTVAELFIVCYGLVWLTSFCNRAKGGREREHKKPVKSICEVPPSLVEAERGFCSTVDAQVSHI